MSSSTYPCCKGSQQQGFTLMELIIVVAIILILVGLLVPTLSRARASGKRVYCANNLKVLHRANQMYADEHGEYVAAASDMCGANRNRWHGERSSASRPFDGSEGPLAPYLGGEGRVRSCPSFRRFSASSGANAFEASCGGYGYNAIGVGSQTYLQGYGSEAMARGMATTDIQNPCRTVMFSDCAFPQPYGNNPTHLIEYSFVEPYHWVFSPGEESSYRADPSMHFRHGGRANVVWCDGHVSSEKMETMAEDHFSKWNIGWCGSDDNSLFDPN
jgi:prepilin-type processing-associated H-X9-DG protein/prepilin-type N-terminal cleavage/methylation domain-containing protein